MLLSVIILNWNSGTFLKGCLASLLKNTLSLEKEIIVIDNGSDKERVEDFLKGYSGILLVKNFRNMGVGPARNQGLSFAKGEYILILDVDTIVQPGAIEALLAVFAKDRHVAIAGPKLTDINGKLQFSCRNFPTLLSKIYRQLPLTLQGFFLKDEELRGWAHDQQREVGYCIGACQLIRKQALRDIGLYDPRMFYGAEEIDYCLRAWKKGWKVVYCPDALITHFEQRISRRSLLGKMQIAHFKSLLIYFSKHRYLFRPPKIPCFKSAFL